MSLKKVTINPATRLEGHAKIEIFLDKYGTVDNAYLQFPELRGFEKFCEGRRAEDMPQITSRICGVCPVAHHMASTKALDMAFNAEPPPAAKKLRELMYCGSLIYDHTLHFYFLGGPDFLVGPDAAPADRNIIGILKKVGLGVVGKVIEHRAYGQRIVEIIGGKATHPVSGLPGGMSKALTNEERLEIEKMLKSSLEFAKFSLSLFKERVLKNYVDMIQSDMYTLDTYYMGLVDENNKVNFYDGMIRVVDPEGKEFVKFTPREYLDVIEEHVEPWTYGKMPYLKKVGWRGLEGGSHSGIYRVGPLARLNASEGMVTPLAQEEYKQLYEALGGKPVHSTMAYHWARLVELLYAAERGLQLVGDDEILSKDIRSKVGAFGEGVGVVEAARGTLFHHYVLDEDALVKRVNLIVPSTHNNPAMCTSIKDAAKGLIHGENVEEGLLNRIEMVFRAYDPCVACATHLDGSPALEVKLYNHDRNLLKTIRR
jgi:F420-non-reducing hydrogenase large subunit